MARNRPTDTDTVAPEAPVAEAPDTEAPVTDTEAPEAPVTDTEAPLAAYAATQAPEGDDTEAARAAWLTVAAHVAQHDEQAPFGMLTGDGAEAVRTATRWLRGGQRASVPRAFQEAEHTEARATVPPDTGRMLAAQAVAMEAAGTGAAPARPSIDHGAILVSRVAAVAAMLTSATEAASGHGVEAPDSIGRAVEALLSVPGAQSALEAEDGGFQAVWKAAYGGPAPDASKVPGKRTGGGGPAVARDLSRLAGEAVSMAHKGTVHTAHVTDTGALRVDGHHEDESPSGAATRLKGSNESGLRAWRLADGRSLAEAHDALIDAGEEAEAA